MMLLLGTALLAAAAAAAASGFAGDAAATPQTAISYRMFNDFAITAISTGPWSYLADGKRFKFADTSCFNAVSGFHCWTTKLPIPNSITVGSNVSKRVISYLTIVLPTNHLAFDPEGGSVAVRWTAPKDGT